MRRTTATTDYLKECMGTALLELMKEKPIEKISMILSILVYTFFSRMFDLMLPPVAKHSIVVA